MDNQELVEFSLEISVDDAAEDDVDYMTRQLLNEINGMDVESAELTKSADAAPDGTKAIDPVMMGQIAVAVLPVAITKTIEAIQAWASRGENRTVKFKYKGLEFEGHADDLQKLLATIDAQAETPAQPETRNDTPRPESAQSDSPYERAIFVSYAWGGESERTMDELERAFVERGIRIVRDKKDLGYKGVISEFMERIGRGVCVIVVISDKYLRSPNCMFELAEIAEGKQFHDRVFPIVLSDANIYDPVKRIEYIKHWESKRAELADAMRTLDPANLQGVREDIDLYDRIRDEISGLTSVLKDMNTLTPEMHERNGFAVLINAVERAMSQK
jgi:hypothetical protein